MPGAFVAGAFVMPPPKAELMIMTELNYELKIIKTIFYKKMQT